MPAALIPLITTALTTAGASAGVAAVGANVIVGAIGLGLTFGANALFGGQKTQKPQDLKAVLKASVAIRSRHYGTVKVGGNIVFIEPTQHDLAEAIVFGQGPVSAFNQFFADDKPLTLDGGSSGSAVNDPFNGDSIRIYPHSGAASQAADGFLTSRFPSLWTAAHQLNGLAYAAVQLNGVKAERIPDVYPKQENTPITAILNGVPVYDPRTGATAFSRNFALMLRDYVIHPDGARLPADAVDDSLIITAANICDEAVPVKAGGTIARYNGQLSYTLDTEPKDVLGRIIQATDGRVYLTPEGKIGFQAGKWIEPAVHITEDQILEVDLRDRAGPYATSNRVIVKYTFPEARYSEATADEWRDEASIDLLGELSATPEIYECQSHNHARRLAKLIQHRSNPRWTGTVRTTLYGLNAYDQRWIRMTILEGYGIDRETFEVTGWALETDTMTVVLQISSFDGAAYDFDPATEEGTAPTVPTDLVSTITIPVPTGFALTTEDRISGGTTYRAAVFSADPPAEINTANVFEISSDGGATWQEVNHPQDANHAEFGPLVDGNTYVGRAKTRSLSGRESAYTDILSVDGQPLSAPAEPVNFMTSGGSTSVSLSVQAANDTFTKRLQFRKGTTFESAAIISDQAANANDVRTYSDYLGAGSARYWAASVNAVGVVTPTAYQDASVTG